MVNGIKEALTEEIEKNSPTLNRTAKYERVSRVSRLPRYLPIQFIRFFWKPEQRIRAKILRKVKFPLHFDATELCTPELQSKFSKAKLKLKELDDAKEAKRREEKRRKIDLETSGEPGATAAAASTSSSSAMDTQEEKINWSDFLDPELLADEGCNATGQYELCAVLTHVGRSADSGHYIGWVKKEQGKKREQLLWA